MQIYFSAPIRSSRERAADYMQMIKVCSKHGEVLTEHVGDEKRIPSNDIGLVETQIYQRDMELLKKSNVVVADVSIPSLGVGYELAQAEQMKKAVLCLFQRQDGARLSAMVKGNPSFKIVEYDTLSQACSAIDTFLLEKR